MQFIKTAVITRGVLRRSPQGRIQAMLKRMFMLAITLVAVKAHAAYTCAGTVDFVDQAYDGSVLIDSVALYGNETGRQICNLSTTWKGVAPAVCQGWLARLLLSEAAGTPVTVQYNDSLTACSQQLAFGSATNPWAMW